MAKGKKKKGSPAKSQDEGKCTYPESRENSGNTSLTKDCRVRTDYVKIKQSRERRTNVAGVNNDQSGALMLQTCSGQQGKGSVQEMLLPHTSVTQGNELEQEMRSLSLSSDMAYKPLNVHAVEFVPIKRNTIGKGLRVIESQGDTTRAEHQDTFQRNESTSHSHRFAHVREDHPRKYSSNHSKPAPGKSGCDSQKSALSSSNDQSDLDNQSMLNDTSWDDEVLNDKEKTFILKENVSTNNSWKNECSRSNMNESKENKSQESYYASSDKSDTRYKKYNDNSNGSPLTSKQRNYDFESMSGDNKIKPSIQKQCENQELGTDLFLRQKESISGISKNYAKEDKLDISEDGHKNSPVDIHLKHNSNKDDFDLELSQIKKSNKTSNLFDPKSEKSSNRHRRSTPTETSGRIEFDRNIVIKRYSDSRIPKRDEVFDTSFEKPDEEYEEFREMQRNIKKNEYVKVTEMFKDLFEMSKEYSLAHCVAEDLSMGSGIAVHFKREFKSLGALLDQRQKQGGLAILDIEEQNIGTRYIYYLVTKRKSEGKPTFETFWRSLKKMRDHVKDHEVKKLAIPRLGCGLDRLDWDDVKPSIEFLFKDVDVDIVVCNFQQTEGNAPTKNKGCKVVHSTKSIADIETGTIIIYFSTEQGDETDEMKELRKKFSFMTQFYRSPKKIGEIIKFEDKSRSYTLYGCIVRKSKKDRFNFQGFEKCLSQINKFNRKDGYCYVGIPIINNGMEDLLNEKIVIIAQHIFRQVEIHICACKELTENNNTTEEVSADK